MLAQPTDPCPPKFDKNGAKVEQVRIPTGKGGTRCVKAGAKASKEAGVCPAGKVLVTAKYKVPRPDGSVQIKTGTRCVKTTGKYEHLKQCPPGKVMVEQLRRGMTPPRPGFPSRPWSKVVRLCLTPDTAQRGSYKIVG